MRARRPSDLALAIGFAALAACPLACAPESASSSDGGPARTTDGGSAPAADASPAIDASTPPLPPPITYAPDNTDAGDACTLPPIDPGPSVPLQRVAASPPAASGGIVAPGRYVLTAVDVFTGPAGASGPTGDALARRCVLATTTYGCVEREGDASPDAGATAAPAPFAGKYVASGTSLAFTRACPPDGTLLRGFTVAGKELHLFVTLSGATVRETMTLEPP